MKQEKFINVLKKVINEEVRSVIKQELTEILKSGLQSTVNELQETKQEKIVNPVKKTVSNNNPKFKKNKFSSVLYSICGRVFIWI